MDCVFYKVFKITYNLEDTMKNFAFIISLLVLGLFYSCTVSQQPTKDINYLNEELPGLTAKLFGSGIIPNRKMVNLLGRKNLVNQYQLSIMKTIRSFLMMKNS